MPQLQWKEHGPWQKKVMSLDSRKINLKSNFPFMHIFYNSVWAPCITYCISVSGQSKANAKQSKAKQMTSPLKLQIKGNLHWKLSKLRPTLTYPAKRVWCWHFIENLTERKVQKPSLGWKVMNCWRDPVDKK